MTTVIETIEEDWDPYGSAGEFEPTSDYAPRPNTEDPAELVERDWSAPGSAQFARALLDAPPPKFGGIEITLPTLHAGQATAWWKFFLSGARKFILRCGRRFGKTDEGKTWIMDAAIRGLPCAWYAPEHKTWSEAYSQIVDHLGPLIAPTGSSKNAGVIRLINGGRIDFWTLGNPIAGRGRHYARVVIDEAAFGKDGDKTVDGSTMAMWELVIEPTLYDLQGEVLIMSNSAGKKVDNFLYMISPQGGDTQGKYGFVEHHATMRDNPLLPHRLPGESYVDWQIRRANILEERKRTRDPLVYAQEDEAEFVDWSGKAFFTEEHWLVNGQPISMPRTCAGVFATIDTALKTGQEHDGSAVIYWAVDKTRKKEDGWLVVLDWEIIKIEGASLVMWLPGIYKMLEFYATKCLSRSGTRLGAFIEDKGSGTVLLQQAARAGWAANPIKSALTSMGKDERALMAHPYHYQGLIKVTELAWTKTTTYNGQTLNHFTEQVKSFRMADKDANKRQDDLLDDYCYGISVGLGNEETGV